MNKKRIMIIIGSLLILFGCFIFCIRISFGRTLCGSIDELNCVVIRYYDSQVAGYYKEIRLTEKDRMEQMYTTIKNVEHKKLILFSNASSEPDPGWKITFEFATGTERFDNTVSGDAYGIRKYISMPFSEGYVILSSEEVHDLVNEIISKDM